MISKRTPARMAVEPDAHVIEIVLRGGERLHLRTGASPDLVRAVVAALRSPAEMKGLTKGRSAVLKEETEPT